MATIHDYSSLCYEYFCFQSIEWFLAISVSICLQPTRSHNKIDTTPVVYREYYNLLLARAQMVDRLLLEWRTQQALEFENRNRQFTKEEIFEDNQMVYLLAPHSSALQMSTTKFRQDFIGPLFIDTTLNKMHYRLKDATGWTVLTM